MKSPIVGIDLGTTNSSIAAVIDGIPRVLDIDGQPTMPSCVGIDPSGQFVVGTAARNLAGASGSSTLFSVKRHMGTDIRLLLGTKDYSPEEISAMILSSLKRSAESTLGCPIKEAVITVPAFFNERQRQATRNAGEIAGFDVKRILNEPTAAALAYGTLGQQNENLLVYDLGGGTFDVSVVVSQEGIVEVKSSHGDTLLGGDDFDDLLVKHVVDLFLTKHGIDLSADPATSKRLKFALEATKRRLSDEPFAVIREEYISPGLHLDEEIDRTFYESLIAPLIAKTIDCVGHALNDAGIAASELHKIMMVGGSTRTPLVQKLLGQRLRKEPRWEINPDLIVAMGAAIQGANFSGNNASSILVDITPHTFSTGAAHTDYYNNITRICVPLIPRNSPLPVAKSEVFYTMAPGQEKVNVTAYQGEHTQPELNSLVGNFTIDGLDPTAPENSMIIISFGLDLSGMLKITATEKHTGLSKSIQLDTLESASQANLQESRQQISNLLLGIEDEEEEEDDYDNGIVDMELLSSSQEADIDTESMLKEAKELRHRAESVITKGISKDDTDAIHQLLTKVRDNIADHNFSHLQSSLDSLSDLLFYLED